MSAVLGKLLLLEKLIENLKETIILTTYHTVLGDKMKLPKQRHRIKLDQKGCAWRVCDKVTGEYVDLDGEYYMFGSESVCRAACEEGEKPLPVVFKT